MSVFPSTDPYPTWPYTVAPRYKTIITEYDSGVEQRRQKWLFPKFDVTLGYTGLKSTDANKIYDFYQARRGAYESFVFHDIYPNTSYVGLLVSYHSVAAQVNFTMPGRNTSAVKVYLDGVETTAFSISATAGADDKDRLTLSATASTGIYISCDFVGRLSVDCRFADDNLDRTNFDVQLFSYGIKLKGI